MRFQLKNTAKYENLKELRKQFIKEFKNKAKTHYNNWLDSQLRTIENSSNGMKMLQAVKFLNLKKPTKILAEMKNVRNYFE